MFEPLLSIIEELAILTVVEPEPARTLKVTAPTSTLPDAVEPAGVT
jgi:hypothetical protein